MEEGAVAAPEPTVATWRVLLGYARPHWSMLVVGGLLSLATAATGLALPLVVRELISTLGTDRPVTGLVALMTVLVVANAAIGALGGYVLRRTAEPWSWKPVAAWWPGCCGCACRRSSGTSPAT